MGVYTRPDSKYFWILLDGYRTAAGRPLRERTNIRRDAKAPQQIRDNQKLALQAFHARMTALARGDQPAEKKPAVTFAALATWFETHELPRRKGREREAPLIPKLIAALGHLPATQVTRSRVTELWISWRLTTPVTVRGQTFRAGPKTVNREVALIKAILQTGVPEYFDPSPLYGMPLLKTTTPKRRLLTPDEEQRLLAVMAPDDTALFLVGLDSLVRLGDLLDIRRRDDAKDRIWIGDPKAGGGFDVPVSSRARKALDAWYREAKPAPDDYVFARRRTAKTERDRRSAIRKMLARYCAACDPPIPYGRTAGGITFHWATRRTGLTRMLSRNVDLGTAQKIGRWKTADVVLSVYHELIDEDARRAVEAVGRRAPRRRHSA